MMDPGRKWADAFERLSPDNLEELLTLAHPDIRFVDPFHEVIGKDAFEQVLRRMLVVFHEPRLRVLDRVGDSRRQFFLWHFSALHPRLGALHFEGTSRVLFDAKGQAVEHIDYWDTATALYARVPLLGRLLKALRRRVAAA